MKIRRFKSTKFQTSLDGRPIFFIGRQQEDGDFAILHVDVFGKGINVPVAALSAEHIKARTHFIDDAWMDATIVRHEKLRATNGYVPPVHEWHNDDDTNTNRSKIAFGCDLHRGIGGPEFKEVVLKDMEGVERTILAAMDSDHDRSYMNFRGIPKEVFFAKILSKGLPYRSVEILDTAVPDISSVALMFSTPPFFALRPLNVFYDTSKKEPAFNFEPEVMPAHFAAGNKSFFFFAGATEMKNKLLRLCAMFNATGLAKTKGDYATRLRLMFAADDEPPTEAEILQASEEAEEKGEELGAHLNVEDIAAKTEGDTATKLQDKPVAPEPEVMPGAVIPEDIEPVKPEPELKLDGIESEDVQPAAPPEGKLEPVVPDGADGAGGIASMVEKAISDALAPLVHEIRSMLNNSVETNAPPGVDTGSPIVSMAAKLKADLVKLIPQLRKKYGSKAAAFSGAGISGNGKVDITELSKAIADQISSKFDSRFASLEETVHGVHTQTNLAARISRFQAIIEDEVAKSNGSIKVNDVRGIAVYAAELPSKHKYKVANKDTGMVEDHEKDMGEVHIRQILSQAGAGDPPMGLQYGAVEEIADQDVDVFKHNTNAFRIARAAAKEYDEQPGIRRIARSGRASFVASEVYGQIGMQPSKAK